MPEIVTFGCRLNAAESDIMQRHAAAAGMNDAVIVNTCAVTAKAERQAGQAIRRIKRENPAARILVTGCAAQIDAEKYAAMAEVDAVIPNDDKLKSESFLKLRGKEGQRTVLSDLAAFSWPLLSPAAAPLQRAFVQIQNGCDHRCTFCIIPFGRGASKSLPVEAILAQIRAARETGFNEIVLTGVDIASYGRDLPERMTLGAVIRRIVAAVPDLPRLRLSSLDPAAMDSDLWDMLAHEPRLMPHAHLSLQSGDDLVLKRMKRRHSADDVRRLCDRARRARPDIFFGADIIAGFPTETDAMAENTFALVRDCGLTWLHVFPYSARKGTPAARMPQVHGSARKERADRLRALGEAAAQRHYESLIGQAVPILVEKNGAGCTPHFAKVTLLGDAPVGQIVDAQVTGVENGAALARVRHD